VCKTVSLVCYINYLLKVLEGDHVCVVSKAISVLLGGVMGVALRRFRVSAMYL
jgi:hypothetical protein